jgi:predicted extracellular nuclease
LDSVHLDPVGCWRYGEPTRLEEFVSASLTNDVPLDEDRPEPRSPRSRRIVVTAAVAAALVTAGTAFAYSGQAGAIVGAVGRADAKIHDIQGASHKSPMDGQQVSNVTGVVVAKSTKGFWIVDPQPDDNDATSEGLFVFTNSAPSQNVGDSVTVSGTVKEFRPGGDGGSGNLSTTELTDPSVKKKGKAKALPEPVKIGPGGRVAPPAPRADNPGDVEASDQFDPTKNALDFYESMEGMLVRVTDAVTSGPLTENNDLSVLPGGEGAPRTARGGIAYSSYDDPNTERVILSRGTGMVTPPDAAVGQKLPGDVDGVLDYSFGAYKMLLTKEATVEGAAPERETTRAANDGELAVATFNVENLDPKDDPAKFDGLANAIVKNLSSPDLIALEEIQDENGATDDGTVTAEKTLQMLSDAVAKAGGPKYEWAQINPENNADGGEPGGNIRPAFFFRTDRGLAFVKKGEGDATTATDVQGGQGGPELTLSPGRVDPSNGSWEATRKPLAGQFTFNGKNIIAIANHFSSKGGDQSLMGRFQPPARDSEQKRNPQAESVRAFVDKVNSVDPNANVIVLGDLNDFEFSKTTDILTAGDALVDLPRTLPQEERYSFVFDGNSQFLDHILISKSLDAQKDYDVVHVNSEYSAKDAGRVSDHDPQIVRLFGSGG